jgi:hypothetical protein
MKENPNLKVYALSEINHFKVHGRTTGCLSPLTLFWTGSGIEFNAKGSELWVELEADLVRRPVISRFRYSSFRIPTRKQ